MNLITTRYIELPDRCIKCNAPANGYRLRRTLHWHDPLYYLIIFAGVLIYAVVALVVRKTARVHIGMCERHRNNRRMALYLSWGMFLVSIVMFIMAISAENGIVALLGFFLLMAAGIYGAIGPRTIRATKIDEQFAWIRGVDREYLAQFPQWPRY